MTLVLLSVALALVGNLATSTVTVGWRWWPLSTWSAVALLALAAVVIERARSAESATVVATAGTLDGVVADLAFKVREQWAQEATRRELNRPFPLQVRWASTSREVPTVVDDAREFPLQGNADEIVTVFRRLRHRQLVVLGEPGAGKTALAVLLMLGLLESLADEPVPVFIPIASWDPHVRLPQEFAAQRLCDEYGFLSARTEDGRSLAELLIARTKLVLVFDGLDELPDERRATAIESLDQFGATGKPLVVTCRSNEYEQAVLRSGRVLSQSAVIEIEPVSLESAITFLSQAARTQPRWQPVFSHLRQDNRQNRVPLAQALSTPLMITLARSAYRTPASDPVALLDMPDATSIAGILIEEFIRNAYNTDLPRPGTPAYGADRARVWLGSLAYLLFLSGTMDFWWGRFRVAHLRLASRGQLPWRLFRFLDDAHQRGVLRRTGSAWQFRHAFFQSYLAQQTYLSRLRGGSAADAEEAGHRLVDLHAAQGSIGDLRALADLGHQYASRRLTSLLAGQGNIDELRVRTEAGDGRAAVWLADLLAARGQVGEAVKILEEARSPSAEFRLNYLLARQGAISELRTRADGGDLDAGYRLAGVLAERGDVDEALAALRRLADTGDHHAADLLPDLLVAEGRPDEAIAYLRARADGGDEYARNRLIAVHGADTAMAFLRARADSGDSEAARRLAVVVTDNGQAGDGWRSGRRAEASDHEAGAAPARPGNAEEAIATLQARLDSGDGEAAQQLAGVLAEHGRAEEGIAILRARAAAGDRKAGDTLAVLPAAHGHAEEAIAMLRARADGGDGEAARLLAGVLAENGRADQAIAILRACGGLNFAFPPSYLLFFVDWERANNEADARRDLAALLARLGRRDELRTRADVGDLDAASRLADLLAAEGSIGELRKRAGQRDGIATVRLAELLAEQGRWDSARTVIRPWAYDGNEAAAILLLALTARVS